VVESTDQVWKYSADVRTHDRQVRVPIHQPAQDDAGQCNGRVEHQPQRANQVAALNLVIRNRVRGMEVEGNLQ